MFRSLFIWLSLTSVAASRIQSQADTESDTKFGASCDSLQNRFHTQVHALRVALEARTSESAITQARFAMRMHGIIRTLRRAQTCTWVVENNSDDIEEMRGIMQELLAENPCGEAARSELEAGAAAESVQAQMQAMSRALSTLMSDDCEVSDIQPGDDQAQLEEVEEEMQDAIDEIMDAEDEGEAFIQLDQSGRFRSFMRAVGVFFLMLFLLLACVSAAAFIVALLAAVLGGILHALVGVSSGSAGLAEFLLGGALGAAVGLVGCVNQLYNSVLPRLSQ